MYRALQPEPIGLGTLGQMVVIASVLAMVLFRMVMLAQRRQAVESFAAASAQAVAVAERDQADADRRGPTDRPPSIRPANVGRAHQA